MDDFLRNQCKYLKCYQGISYKVNIPALVTPLSGHLETAIPE